MREIKFRYRVDQGYFCGDRVIATFIFTIDQIEERNGEYNAVLENYKIVSRNLFTGLKDKNGKEIYEGDICSMKSFDTYVKGEVRYQPPEFCLRTANDYWELDYGDPAYIEIKIIGNIYENPELL